MPSKRTIQRKASPSYKQDHPRAPIQGAPPKPYDEVTGTIICELITNGLGLVKACEQVNVSYNTVVKWLQNDASFMKMYAQAREIQADYYADNILETIDNASSDRNEIERAKIKAEALKWIASKLKPKRYGDKLDLTSDGEKLEQPIYGGLSVAPKREPIEAELVDTKQLEAKHRAKKSKR